MGFFMEYFTTVKIYILGGRLGSHHLFQASQGFLVVRHLVRQFINLLSGDNSLDPFRLL